jgi:hypothetical protein
VSEGSTNTTNMNAEDHTEEGKNRWSEEATFLLIETFKDYKHKFDSPMYNKKQVWGMISNKLKEHNILKSSAKCAEKWRNLKKNYDKVVSENKKTGNNKHTWKCF